MFQSLSPASPTPLWLDLTKSIIGPVIAAVVVIVGLIWRDWIERRNVAQSWFEQTYITEGIDILIANLSALQSSLDPMRRKFFPPEVIPFASHILGRMEVVIPSLEFLFACATVEAIAIAAAKTENPVLLNPKELTEIYEFTGRLLAIAENTRLALLHITIRSKKQVYGIRSNAFLLKVHDKDKEFMNGEALYPVHRRLIEHFSVPIVKAAVATMSETQKDVWRKTYSPAK